MPHTYPPTWASHPFPLIPQPTFSGPLPLQHASVRIATFMTLLHNSLLRSLNAIYLQAPHIPPAHVPSFLKLVELWHDELHHHHTSEETHVFPRLGREFGPECEELMRGNVEQHQEFEPGLAKLYAFATGTKVDEYDGMRLREIIDGFGEVLQRHLAEEIGTLLELKRYDSERLWKEWEAADKEILKTVDMSSQHPLLLGGHDMYFDGVGKAPVPWFVFYVIHYWFERKYRACWKFLPCTTWGVPRALPFARDEKA